MVEAASVARPTPTSLTAPTCRGSPAGQGSSFAGLHGHVFALGGNRRLPDRADRLTPESSPATYPSYRRVSATDVASLHEARPDSRRSRGRLTGIQHAHRLS